MLLSNKQKGIWGVGVATEMAQLSVAPGGCDKESWVLCFDGVVKHNGQDIHKLADIPQEGDTIVFKTMFKKYYSI
jgi:hypothetical protein